MTAKDSAALDALAYVAFSSTSDLYQELVIKEQKVDRSSARTLRARSIPRCSASSARVKKQADVEHVRDRILATVKAFQEKPVDAAKLDAVRKRLRYQLALRSTAAMRSQASWRVSSRCDARPRP